MKRRLLHLNLVYRLLLVFFLVVTAVWPLTPAPARAAPPDPSLTPTSPATSTRDSSEAASDVSAEDAPTPTPGDLPPEISESLARQALEATLAKSAGHYGPVSPVDVTSFQVAASVLCCRPRSVTSPAPIACWRSKPRTRQAPSPLPCPWWGQITKRSSPTWQKGQAECSSCPSGRKVGWPCFSSFV